MESIQGFLAGLNLTLIFGGFVAAGLLFCVFTFVFGGDVDDGGGGLHVGGAEASHAPGCFITPSGLAFFTTSFGAYGLIALHGLGLSPILSVVLSVVLAFVTMMALNYVFFRVFVRSGSTVEKTDIEGLRAEVYTAIAEGGVGEVLYRDQRGRQKAMARSKDGSAIASGKLVVIDSAIGSTLVVSPVSDNNCLDT